MNIPLRLALVGVWLLLLVSSSQTRAQEAGPAPTSGPTPAGDEAAPSGPPGEDSSGPTDDDLLRRVAELERRLAAVEGGPAEPASSDSEGDREPPGLLERALGEITVEVQVVGSFVWNLNDPPGRTDQNALRVSDRDHNTFSLVWSKFGLSRAVSGDELDVGFRLELAAGRMVENTLSLDPEFLGGEELNLANAYLELLLPTPHFPVKVTVGRAYGWFGVESLELHQSQLHTLSVLANFTPYTNTGVFVETELVEGLSYMQYVGNGAEVVIDNNDSKTVGGRLSLNAGDDLAVALHWIYGAERPDNDSDQRWQLELDVTWTPSERTALYLMLHYGQEEGQALNGGTGKFGGVSLALRQALAVEESHDLLTALGRVTTFRDQGGVNSGIDQTITELSAGLELKPLEPVWVRLEARVDTSSARDAFLGHRGLVSRRHQTTLAIAAGVAF